MSMYKMKKFSAAVAKKLKHYVYVYVDPRDGSVFYVGKGQNNRALAHADGTRQTPHDKVIRELKERGQEPVVEILVHGLDTNQEALAVEMAAIDLLGLDQLTNRVHGHHKSKRGRMTLDQIKCMYEGKKATIKDAAMLIRVAVGFRYGMTALEKYDLTRAAWVANGVRRDRAKYALAVYDGVVQEVYAITHWLPSGSTFLEKYPKGNKRDDRWEFVGTVAEEDVRRRYLNHSVAHYFARHSQNPIKYVNCDDV